MPDAMQSRIATKSVRASSSRSDGQRLPYPLAIDIAGSRRKPLRRSVHAVELGSVTQMAPVSLPPMLAGDKFATSRCTRIVDRRIADFDADLERERSSAVSAASQIAVAGNGTVAVWTQMQAPIARADPCDSGAQPARGCATSQRRHASPWQHPLRLQHQIARDQEHPDQRDRQEDLPAEPHQLVVAVARHGRLHPGEDEEEEQDLAEEPEDARDRSRAAPSRSAAASRPRTARRSCRTSAGRCHIRRARRARSSSSYIRSGSRRRARSPPR